MSHQYISSTGFVQSAYGKDYAPGTGSFFASYAEIDQFLQSMSSLIDIYCGRSFIQDTYSDSIVGQGQWSLGLRNFPVASIQSITYVATFSPYFQDTYTYYQTTSIPSGQIDPSMYVLATNTGMLHLRMPLRQGFLYTINYTAGSVTPPDAIVLATQMLANTYLNAIQTDSVGFPDGGALTSFQFGKFKETYSDQRQKNTSYNEAIPQTVEAILRRYKLVR